MKEEILKFFRGDVEDDEETLMRYSHDASLLEVRPRVVVYPMDSEDVKNLVKWVNDTNLRMSANDPKEKISITARCAGTDMSGGALGESIIMDFTRYMNKLIGGPLPIKTKNEWEVSVQPGMLYREFEKITLIKGLVLPCYTASKSLNAMGGMYGNNSAGERTLKYGKTEDYVLSAKVVFTDGNEYVVRPFDKSELNKKMAQGGTEGEIYRRIYKLIAENEEDIKHAKPKVSKNSAGYYIWNVMNDTIFDLNKLLVGSQGTLGIVTEITFKLIPNPRHSKLVTIFMNDLAPLGRLVDEILELSPEMLEAYDDKTMKLAVKFFPDLLKHKGIAEMAKFLWSFWPEFFMVVSSFFGGGLPKLILLAEFDGANEEETQAKCKKLEEKIKDFKFKVHITRDEMEANKYWEIRRESFALLRKHIKGKRTAPFIDDIIVRPEFLPKFLPELNNILQKYDLIYTLAGHAGDGNFHVIPLMDLGREDASKIILNLGEEVYDLVMKYRGSITAEHNDGLIRTPYLPKMFGEKTMNIFTEIKKIFDPQNIFNPGKKIALSPEGNGAGTKEYIASHIAIEHKAEHKV